jgi:myotubularin-related protein 14
MEFNGFDEKLSPINYSSSGNKYFYSNKNIKKLKFYFFSSIDDQGLLIHCISGWDRTPLFISLLRLSLWADGWIHQSLTVEEILYLTLAYDWYLFGYEVL